jgi:signal transduction histidine kinase
MFPSETSEKLVPCPHRFQEAMATVKSKEIELNPAEDAQGVWNENASLYAEIRRRATQLEVASQVAQKVVSILDLDQLLAEIVRLIRLKFGYYHIHIFLVDQGSNEIVLQELSGEEDASLKRQGLRLKIGEQGICGWVAANGTPLVCNDVSQESRFYPHELLPKTKSELAIPMRFGEKIIGVLDVQSDELGAFGQDDSLTLQILADQVAIAIRNAHLFRETRRQLETLRALHDISLEITSQLESEQVLKIILKQAAHLLSAEASTISIYDSQENVIHKIAVFNLPMEFQGLDLKFGEGLAGQVIATGKPIFVNDYSSWAFSSRKFVGGAFNAILGVPLRWHNQIVGALEVLDKRERRAFSDKDVHLLGLFGDLVSVVLKNAELYQALRQASEELENKVTQRTEELSKAKQALAEQAEHLRRLLRDTVNVQEEERTRIARDLHDGSNQLISGTLYEIQAAEQSLRNDQFELGLEKLGTARNFLRMIEVENRKIITGLRPSILDAEGLVAALKWHAGEFQENFGFRCSVEITGQPVQLSSEAEITIYRIVQEALNNTIQHAKASSVEIYLEFSQNELRVTIEDDGIGFDRETARKAVDDHMGLIGINERTKSIGGRLQVSSLTGHGTRLELWVPFD